LSVPIDSAAEKLSPGAVRIRVTGAVPAFSISNATRAPKLETANTKMAEVSSGMPRMKRKDKRGDKIEMRLLGPPSGLAVLCHSKAIRAALQVPQNV
jgi:hypothetical protein